MSDPVDDFWLSMVPDYQGKRFKSVTRGGADLDKIAGDDATAGEDAGKAEETPGIDGLVAFVRLTLKDQAKDVRVSARSEEHTSELQSLMRISYAVFCLKKKKIK